MVSCVIFDLDDTLCDYRQAMENAKRNVSVLLNEEEIEPAAFWTRYHEIEPLLFRQFTENKLTVTEYRIRRYSDVLQAFDGGKTHLADRLNHIYMNEANHNIQLFEDAIPCLQFLKKQGITSVVLTNGPSDGQRSKIDALGLEPYIDRFYISAEIGCSKPSKEAFQYVLDDMQLPFSKVRMVGDSIEYDIRGAQAAGIKGMLLDRAGRHSDYEGRVIRSLSDLYQEMGA